MLSYIDILVVNKTNNDHISYEFVVSRSCVLAAFMFKIANDPYYTDVQLNSLTLSSLHDAPSNVSGMLHCLSPNSLGPQEALSENIEHELLHPNSSDLQPSTFVVTLPDSHTKIDEILTYTESSNSTHTHSLQWPIIDLSLVN